MKFRILVVDDEQVMRDLLKDILETSAYEVATAEDGVIALEVLERDPHFHMVVSDINMPRMKGFELLDRVAQKYPSIKRVLITAYNVEDYISIANKFNIGNIITKTTPFNFDEIATLVRNLLNEDIFGLDRYLLPKTEVKKLAIIDPKLINKYAEQVVTLLGEVKRRNRLKLVVVELLTNAIFYGVRGENGAAKENWSDDFLLESGQVEICYGIDNNKYGFSICDHGGKLQKRSILHWLERQIKKDISGLPVGLMDSHGRGIYIAREYIDRLIINIKQGQRTEITALNYHDQRKYTGHKPLLINEI